ncbi:MAG: methylmalonyl Co-A mutase-associated GTPase MeaB [Vicingaceae bacterium]
MELDEKVYIDGILKGDRVWLSKAITIIESTHPNHFPLAQKILESCIKHSGKSIRIGITGVPGVGKSTFIDAFGSFLIKEKSLKVAVLAIDPSSTKTKGSILGDKTRMAELSALDNAYIRPSPSSGNLGGVARATQETIILCEAAGFDVIIIETVGVGQSETSIRNMVDFFLLLMLAGAGDELQGIKKGIMEMADAIVINKADGSNLTAAKNAVNTYKSALHLFPPQTSGWMPKVEQCSALEKNNIDKIWDIICEFIDITKKNGFFEKQRKAQNQFWFESTINENILKLIKSNPKVNELINMLSIEIKEQKTTPFLAAQKAVEYINQLLK